MATKTVTHYTDYLDGSTDGVNTIKFGLHGTNYEIDLNAKHQEDQKAALEQFIAAGRKAGASAASTSRRPTGSSSGSSGGEAKAIRAWAAENDVEVPARGRIPGAVVEQYKAARS